MAETNTSQAQYIDVRNQYACVALVSNSISSIDQKARLSQAGFRRLADSVLREKHGQDFEEWWRQTFGFDYDSLTRSEAHHLENSEDAHATRDRAIAAGFESRALPSDAASEHDPVRVRCG